MVDAWNTGSEPDARIRAGLGFFAFRSRPTIPQKLQLRFAGQPSLKNRTAFFNRIDPQLPDAKSVVSGGSSIPMQPVKFPVCRAEVRPVHECLLELGKFMEIENQGLTYKRGVI